MWLFIRSAICLCGIAAFGGERWTAPVLGHVFDEETKAIYPLSGVPGAAALDRAIAVPTKIGRAAVAWGGRPWAVISAADETAGTTVAVWSEDTLELIPMPGAILWTDAVWSDAGVVALFSRSTGRIQVWKGLPRTPEVSTEYRLSNVQAVAVSSEGFVAAGSEISLRTWQGTTARQYALRDIKALAWRLQDGALVVGEATRALTIHNGSFDPVPQVPAGSAIQSIAPDGSAIMSCRDGSTAVTLLSPDDPPAPPGPECGTVTQWVRPDSFVVKTRGSRAMARGHRVPGDRAHNGRLKVRRLLWCVALLASQLAGQAIRQNSGFRTQSIPANDDGSGPLAPLGFTINFFGRERAQGWVNNNGNITFDSPLATYTPFGLDSTRREIVAAFFADVDTRPRGSALVTYGQDTVDGHKAFGANFITVGYFNQHADKLNSFQIVLIERADTGAGNFDLEFNYQRIAWETGDASGGVNGFGGVPASVGWSNGSGGPGTSYELDGSLVPGSFLDSGRYSLVRGRLNSTVQGRFVFRARAGRLRPPLSIQASCPLPTAFAGQTYVQPLAAVGGGAVKRWTIQADPGSPGLPAGLSLSGDGLISGRPDQPGTHEFTLRVASTSEDGEETALRRCSVTVSAPALGITSACPLPGGVVGQAYRRNLQASGGRPPFVWSLAEGSSLPDGLALDPNGTLAGVPTAPGTRVLQLRVTSNPSDGAQPAATNCAITIAPSIQSVQQSACSLPAATVGAPYSQTLDSGEGPGQWLALDGLPAGLALTSDGRIEGTPTGSGASRIRMRFAGAGGTSERSCTIEVSDPVLRIAAACPLPAARTGETYRHQFSVSGGDGTYTWSSAGMLPSGLTLTAQGTLEGLPDSAGNHAFRLLVSDSSGSVAATGCNLTVIRSSFSISSCPLPDATSGVEYSRSLNVEGGIAPYVFAASGELPPGLTLTAAGRVSGRPLESGSWAPQIRVTDRNGNSFLQRCRITVGSSPIRVTTACPLTHATVSVPYLQRLEATGGQPPYQWRLSGSLPSGLELTGDGIVRGTPVSPSSSEFALEVSDAARITTLLRCSLESSLPELPAVKLSALPSSLPAASAGPTISVELTRPYLLPVSGTLVLEAEPDTGVSEPSVNVVDPIVRFRNGQRAIAFQIPAGQLSSPAAITSTGTVASAVTLKAANLKAGTIPIPLAPPPRQFRVPRTVPVLTAACYTTAEIRIEGYTTTRQLTELELSGTPAVRIDRGSLEYFASEESIRTGGAFSLAIATPAAGPIPSGATVSVTNSEGKSAARPLQPCR